MGDLNNQRPDGEKSPDHRQQQIQQQQQEEQQARETVFRLRRRYQQELQRLQSHSANCKAAITYLQRQQNLNSTPQLQNNIHGLQQFLQRLEQQETQVRMKQDHLNRLVRRIWSMKRRAGV